MMPKNILAVVPARSGSKGLPNKNILPVLGHPLLAYSILAGKNSKHISNVICSTDSAEYAELALNYGADPFPLRPREISQDSSWDIEFLQHALRVFQERGPLPAAVALLRPTSPLRRKGFIDEALEFFFRHPEADSLRSIVPAKETPYKMWLQDDTYLTPVLSLVSKGPAYDGPRQALPAVWYQAGVLDIIKTEVILEGSASGNKVLGLPTAREDYCDIDSLDDMKDLESKLRKPIYENFGDSP